MKKRWALVALMALAAGCSCHDHKSSSKSMEKEGEEGNEVKMSINDIPAAAREGLMREAGGAKITSVDKEERKGVTVYETDVMSGGKNWEIVVDGNGKLVSKGVDNEADEKPAAKPKAKAEKEEDDEKEEKEAKNK